MDIRPRHTRRRVLAGGPRLANCALWALTRWARRGGYIVARRSRGTRWPVPHLLWSRDLRTFWSYAPRRTTDDHIPPFFPPLFRGAVQSGT